jgi:hypothetical protein
MIDLATLLQILAVPVIGGLLWLDWKLNDSQKKAVTEVWTAIDGVRTNLENFKLKVAEDYVHGDRLKEVENRIMVTLQRLEDKVDGLRAD